ncbi:MAG: hypothetical protein AAGK78_07595 [Planctomycetota bacterium]
MFDYVVHYHTGYGEPHHDLMIDLGGEGLATWRCPRWPMRDGDVLTPIAEHRRAYLEYEGPTASGRGSVRRVERGTCYIIDNCVRFGMSETWWTLSGVARVVASPDGA